MLLLDAHAWCVWTCMSQYVSRFEYKCVKWVLLFHIQVGSSGQTHVARIVWQVSVECRYHWPTTNFGYFNSTLSHTTIVGCGHLNIKTTNSMRPVEYFLPYFFELGVYQLYIYIYETMSFLLTKVKREHSTLFPLEYFYRLFG